MRSNLPTHPSLRHPYTGAPIQAIGFFRGRPIWPVMGGDGSVDPPADPAGNPGESKPADPPADKTDESKAGNDRGFPADTPVAEMTDAQQAAYWKAQSRKHENRVKSMGDYSDLKSKASEYDKFLEESKTQAERDVEVARAEGRTEALKESTGRLVQAEFKAAAAGRLSDEQRDELLASLDTSKFVTADGEPDDERIRAFVAAIAPRKPADLGQGRRPEPAKQGVSSGRDLWAQRHPTLASKK